MTAAEYFNNVFPDYEFRQSLDKGEIIAMMADYHYCATQAKKGMDEIREESILTPPVQDGGEEFNEGITLSQQILAEQIAQKYGLLYLNEVINDGTVTPQNILDCLHEYAQLRTASLRAELEELKKEFERSEDARDVLNEKLEEAKKTISAQFHKEHSVSDSEELRAELEEAKREIASLKNIGQEIGDKIDNHCLEHMTINGLRFYGISMAEVSLVLASYGYKSPIPF